MSLLFTNTHIHLTQLLIELEFAYKIFLLKVVPLRKKIIKIRCNYIVIFYKNINDTVNESML